MYPVAVLAYLLLGCANATHSAVPASPPPLPNLLVDQRPRHSVVEEGALLAQSDRPLSPGISRTTVEGCLSASNVSEAEHFPIKAPTRSAGPAVTVTDTPSGVLVSHELSHACCLRADVSTRTEDRIIVVAEKLSGSPCRCMCASRVRTSLGLAPGPWHIEVTLDTGLGPKQVSTASVVVPRY